MTRRKSDDADVKVEEQAEQVEAAPEQEQPEQASDVEVAPIVDGAPVSAAAMHNKRYADTA